MNEYKTLDRRIVLSIIKLIKSVLAFFLTLVTTPKISKIIKSNNFYNNSITQKLRMILKIPKCHFVCILITQLFPHLTGSVSLAGFGISILPFLNLDIHSDIKLYIHCIQFCIQYFVNGQLDYLISYQRIFEILII